MTFKILKVLFWPYLVSSCQYLSSRGCCVRLKY